MLKNHNFGKFVLRMNCNELFLYDLLNWMCSFSEVNIFEESPMGTWFFGIHSSAILSSLWFTLFSWDFFWGGLFAFGLIRRLNWFRRLGLGQRTWATNRQAWGATATDGGRGFSDGRILLVCWKGFCCANFDSSLIYLFFAWHARIFRRLIFNFRQMAAQFTSQFPIALNCARHLTWGHIVYVFFVLKNHCANMSVCGHKQPSNEISATPVVWISSQD